MCPADIHNRLSLRLRRFVKPLQFYKENCRAISREPRVHVIFDDSQSPAIQHFARRWGYSSRRNLRNGQRSVVHRIKNR